MGKTLYDFPSGVFDATLEEDFFVTASALGKSYCKALVKGHYDGLNSYPYTYVPDNMYVYPLQKGDKIKVVFHHEDTDFPVLFSAQPDFPDDQLAKIVFPSSEDLSVPDVDKTVSVVRLGLDHYVIQQKQ